MPNGLGPTETAVVDRRGSRDSNRLDGVYGTTRLSQAAHEAALPGSSPLRRCSMSSTRWRLTSRRTPVFSTTSATPPISGRASAGCEAVAPGRRG